MFKFKFLVVFNSFLHVQLNLFEATIHAGDLETSIDRWLLVAE